MHLCSGLLGVEESEIEANGVEGAQIFELHEMQGVWRKEQRVHLEKFQRVGVVGFELLEGAEDKQSEIWELKAAALLGTKCAVLFENKREEKLQESLCVLCLVRLANLEDKSEQEIDLVAKLVIKTEQQLSQLCLVKHCPRACQFQLDLDCFEVQKVLFF